MNCEQAELAINAELDGELEPTEADALVAHLELCAHCRELSDLLHEDNERIQSAFEEAAESTTRVLNAVTSRLSDDISTSVLPAQRSDHSRVNSNSQQHDLLRIALSVAVGFVLAILWFQPWKQQDTGPLEVNNLDGQGTPLIVNDLDIKSGQPQSIAQLVSTTGGIEVCRGKNDRFEIVSNADAFMCPSSTRVRTPDKVLCELQTADGCIVRLNEKTQVFFRTKDTLEVERGQLWCRVPHDANLNVVQANGKTTNLDTANDWNFICNDAQVLADVPPDGPTNISNSDGNVEVMAKNGRFRLNTGESMSVENGLANRNRSDTTLLTASWMNQLLAAKGHENPELEKRVNLLLANIGYNKMSHLYESEIRSLGEYGVLPLLRYVESDRSRKMTNRRHRAMQIVSDLAPQWMIGDLIKLLKDDDSEVRLLTATAIHRLTKRTEGVSLQEWKENSTSTKNAIVRWNKWWADNELRNPAPVKNSKVN